MPRGVRSSFLEYLSLPFQSPTLPISQKTSQEQVWRRAAITSSHRANKQRAKTAVGLSQKPAEQRPHGGPQKRGHTALSPALWPQPALATLRTPPWPLDPPLPLGLTSPGFPFLGL